MSLKDSPLQLPYLCHPSAILMLVLVAELLALVLVLADSRTFSWLQFGITSIVVQWIVLVCTLFLCFLRRWLNQLPFMISSSLVYILCLSVAAVVLWLIQWLQAVTVDVWLWIEQWLIAAIFSGIFLRYLYLQQQLIQQKQAELQARIQSLQARIHPHFFFNSMNTIASLIDMDPKAAEDTIEDLSELFRASLQAPGLVTLQDEIAICLRYLDIEQRRLGERLSICWEFEKPLPDIQIPSLLIQPLLENAVAHGIQHLPQGGELRVVIRSEVDRVQILIDNPIPSVAPSGARSGNCMALDNIRARLQLYFGDKAELKSVVDNQRYRVTLNLPRTC
ncbi:MAG: two-component system sensor histidine kinase AlgZ [Cellvibrionaceae bacterium]|jgi:two-component system sensor histidine kinase AlgZ